LQGLVLWPNHPVPYEHVKLSIQQDLVTHLFLHLSGYRSLNPC
jgi:hypothetical protein